MSSFTTTLFRVAGKGGWTFAPVPDDHAPAAHGAWGRSPVRATVDGRAWNTSVWKDKKYGWVLPVPARIRVGKGAGDKVTVELSPR